MISRDDFFHQLRDWEQEWEKVIEQLPYPQGVILWQGKLAALQQLKKQFSIHQQGMALEQYAYDDLMELFHQLERTFEASKQRSLKNHQKDEIVFYQGMLEGIRQLRLHFKELSDPIPKKKRFRWWVKKVC